MAFNQAQWPYGLPNSIQQPYFTQPSALTAAAGTHPYAAIHYQPSAATGSFAAPAPAQAEEAAELAACFQKVDEDTRKRIWFLALPGPRTLELVRTTSITHAPPVTRHPDELTDLPAKKRRHRCRGLEFEAEDTLVKTQIFHVENPQNPALLYVNREARSVALEHYFPLFSTRLPDLKTGHGDARTELCIQIQPMMGNRVQRPRLAGRILKVDGDFCIVKPVYFRAATDTLMVEFKDTSRILSNMTNGFAFPYERVEAVCREQMMLVQNLCVQSDWNLSFVRRLEHLDDHHEESYTRMDYPWKSFSGLRALHLRADGPAYQRGASQQESQDATNAVIQYFLREYPPQNSRVQKFLWVRHRA